MGCSSAKPVPTLYDEIGGTKALDATVELFYVKVLENEKLAPFFEKVSMPVLKNHQKRFLISVLGGPSEYSGRSIYNAHAGARENGLKEEHFNLVAQCLVATLKELQVKQTHIDQVVEIAISVKNDVLGIKEIMSDRILDEC